VRERREQPALTIEQLEDVLFREGPTVHQLEHVPVDCRSDGLHEVTRQRIAVWPIDVQEAEHWVETDGEGRDPRFRFENGVHVVEHRVSRVHGLARRRLGQRRDPAPEVAPMPRAALGVLRVESYRHTLPRTPVGSRGQGLDLPHLRERPRASSSLATDSDVFLRVVTPFDVLQDPQLSMDFRGDQAPSDVDAERAVQRADLSAPLGRRCGTLRRGDQEDGAVRVQVHERDADPVEPTDCIERNRPGMPDDDQPRQLLINPAEDLPTAVGAHAVFDQEMTTRNGNAEAVARHDKDSCSAGWRRLGRPSGNGHSDSLR